MADLKSSRVSAAIADMARTAQADTDIGRQLQQAAASSDDISATLGQQCMCKRMQCAWYLAVDQLHTDINPQGTLCSG